MFGAEAAARRWYGRSAAELTADQAARLAVALPNPVLRSPRARSRVLDRKAARVVRALHRGGLLSQAAVEEALRALGQAPTLVAPPAKQTEAEAETGTGTETETETETGTGTETGTETEAETEAETGTETEAETETETGTGTGTGTETR